MLNVIGHIVSSFSYMDHTDQRWENCAAMNICSVSPMSRHSTLSVLGQIIREAVRTPYCRLQDRNFLARFSFFLLKSAFYSLKNAEFLCGSKITTYIKSVNVFLQLKEFILWEKKKNLCNIAGQYIWTML